MSVYDYKKKLCLEGLKALEKENTLLTAENESPSGQMAEVRADIEVLEQEKTETEKEAERAMLRAEKAETEANKHEQRLNNPKLIIESMNAETADFKEKIEEQLPP